MMTGRSALLSPLSAARWLLVLVFAAGVYFFHGFLVPVLAALVIGFASWPLYTRLRAALGGRDIWSASIALVLVLSFIIVPIVFTSLYAIKEVRVWVAWAIEANRVGDRKSTRL